MLENKSFECGYDLCLTNYLNQILQHYHKPAELPMFKELTWILGLFLWTTGCVHQMIETLHKCGLSISYPSILNVISHLANQCIELAIKVGSGIHVFCYNNVNLSIFVEQRGSSTLAKVTSGTIAMLYKVYNRNSEHMKIGPIIQHFKQATVLDFCLDMISFDLFYFQLKVVIISGLNQICGRL